MDIRGFPGVSEIQSTGAVYENQARRKSYAGRGRLVGAGMVAVRRSLDASS
jgi:hypothetical protein